jgi:hypothetical protein
MTDIAKETFLIVIEYRMLLGSIKKNDSIGDDTNKKQPWGLSLFNPYVASIYNIQKKTIVIELDDGKIYRKPRSI